MELLKERSLQPDSGLEVVEVADGLQLRTKARFAESIRSLRASRPKKLRQPALETLAIVAYRQPIVKNDPPSHAQSLLFLATCHFGMKNLDEAQAATDKAARINQSLDDPDPTLKLKIACGNALIMRERGGA